MSFIGHTISTRIFIWQKFFKCQSLNCQEYFFTLVSHMNQNWYFYAKTEAELQALDFAKRTGLRLVTICPTLVLGPILQSTVVNASSSVLLKLLKGAYECLIKFCLAIY